MVLTSIIILSYNTLELTKACLESIRAHTDETYEIVVVDNASKDGSAEYLRQQQDVQLLENSENLGFPKGCNQGLAVAKGDSLLLLNSDTVVTANWLKNMQKALYANERTGAVGCLSNQVSNYQQIQVPYGNNMEAMQDFARAFNQSNPGKWEKRPMLVGFCLLFKREVYEKIGGLDERFSPGNFEDNDYCLRIMAAGYDLLLAKDTFVHHWGHSSFRKEDQRIANGEVRDGVGYVELNRRNEKIFFAKWQLPRTYSIMSPDKVMDFLHRLRGEKTLCPVRQERLLSVAIMQTGAKASLLWQAVNESGVGEVCYVVNDQHAGTPCTLPENHLQAMTITFAQAEELYKNGCLDAFIWSEPGTKDKQIRRSLEASGVSGQDLLVLKKSGEPGKSAKKIYHLLKHASRRKKKAALVNHIMDNSGAAIAMLGAAKTLLDNGWQVVAYTLQAGPLEKSFEEIGIQVIVDSRPLELDFADLSWTQHYDLLVVNTILYAHCFHARGKFPPVLWWIHEGEFVVRQYPQYMDILNSLQDYDPSGVLTVPVSPVAKASMEKFAPMWPLGECLPYFESNDFSAHFMSMVKKCLESEVADMRL